MRIHVKYSLDQIEFEKYDSFEKIPNYDSVVIIYCSNNQLTSLPELPSSLTKLHCSNNKLTILPELPNSLTFINCSNNQLTILPELPNSLTKLYC